MQVIEIKGEARKELGKKATKAVRNNETLPCVLYGIENPVHFTTSIAEVRHLVYSPDVKVAQINVGGTDYRAIMKDIQFHPVSEKILHIDFLALEKGRDVKLDVPVRFEGTSPGVKAGGKLIQRLRKVKIKAKSEYLVDEVKLDISKLELGQSVRVRDLKVNENIEILNSPGIPIASIEIPRALRSAQTEEKKASGKK